MKNRDVVRRFVQNRESGNKGYGAVSSRHGALYSYRAKIAEWDGGTLVIYAGWDGYSPTTSKHFKYLHSEVTKTGGVRADGGNPTETDVPVRISWEPMKGRKKDRWQTLE